MTRLWYVSGLCLCFLFSPSDLIEKIKRYLEIFSLILLVHEVSVAMD
jgi:hypothetical protein